LPSHDGCRGLTLYDHAWLAVAAVALAGGVVAALVVV